MQNHAYRLAPRLAQPLAKSLGVSRGSFYWHFADIAALEAEGRNLDDVLRSNRLELADLEKANTMRAADHSAHLARIADLNKKVDMSNVDIHVLQNDLAKREQDLDAFRV